MTGRKITDLEEIDVVEEVDELLIIDKNDTSAGPLGTDKRATIGRVGTVFEPYIDAASAEADRAEQKADLYRHLTPDQLARCMPGCSDPEAWAQAFDDAIEFFDVRDVTMLLAQVGHESADLTRLEENLSYSARRLMQVWPNRFPNDRIASQYAHNPEAF